MTTTYKTQAEISGDGGRIWQAVEPVEVVTIDCQPADWFDARDCAEEIGAVPGAMVRVLVWPGDAEDTSGERGTVYVDTWTVPISVEEMDRRLSYGTPVREG